MPHWCVVIILALPVLTWQSGEKHGTLFILFQAPALSQTAYHFSIGHPYHHLGPGLSDRTSSGVIYRYHMLPSLRPQCPSQAQIQHPSQTHRIPFILLLFVISVVHPLEASERRPDSVLGQLREWCLRSRQDLFRTPPIASPARYRRD